MHHRVWIVLLAVVACKGKGSSQSFQDGVQALCDIPDHVPDNGERYDKRLTEALGWADQHMTNIEVRAIGDLRGMAANKDQLAAAVQKAGIAHCKLLENGMELQSFADAMKIVCEAQVGPDMPKYLQSHLLNTEVVRLLGSMGDVNPADRAKRLQDAVTRAGIGHCAAIDRIAKARLALLPHVSGGVDVEPGPKLEVTPNGIFVEERAIVSIKDGKLDPAELESGATGIMVPRLRKFMTALRLELATKAPVPPPVQVAIDPALTYGLLISAISSAKSAGFTRFEMLVDGGGVVKAIPIVVPDLAAVQAGGLKMIVSITKDHILLWSISGQEGSLTAPKRSVTSDHAAGLQPALAEIVDRRWKRRNEPMPIARSSCRPTARSRCKWSPKCSPPCARRFPRFICRRDSSSHAVATTPRASGRASRAPRDRSRSTCCRHRPTRLASAASAFATRPWIRS